MSNKNNTYMKPGSRRISDNKKATSCLANFSKRKQELSTADNPSLETPALDPPNLHNDEILPEQTISLLLPSTAQEHDPPRENLDNEKTGWAARSHVK